MAVGAGELGGESNDGIHRGAVRHDAVYAILLPAVQQLLPVDEFAGDIAGDDCHDAGLRATDGRMDTGSRGSDWICDKVGSVVAECCNGVDRRTAGSGDVRLGLPNIQIWKRENINYRKCAGSWKM